MHNIYPILSLFFLNNDFHVFIHRQPDLCGSGSGLVNIEKRGSRVKSGVTARATAVSFVLIKSEYNCLQQHCNSTRRLCQILYFLVCSRRKVLGAQQVRIIALAAIYTAATAARPNSTLPDFLTKRRAGSWRLTGSDIKMTPA
ncbi:hypothetical protein, conserved [Trypanosoma brucei gambiense DAL972]|uniref:Uncharacterized protein n=1 Tax=Trypanosoma brucei gambiense (strain MHOM/CI/86/DAL972) TaxID=679716 RepID=C9ZZV3_TRYB9|nr:LOW QUALITY PROTEIN: hypothetical protein, conserved [Trypanosoma brucei gambiense DAL972]CBH16511.1 hypothetical protein, conserved [Trypanosoma brucei gambiense DAL972]|eukprot:XP_011778775.1 LOW QUALITY PROTEIN: hypothetical protein, conserved [Trypanosoma brucei gambiense DAL972]